MPIMKRTMYPPQKDSPVTFLSGDISGTDTVMTVASTLSLPSVVPFPLTLGIDKAVTETVIVTNVNSTTNVLTITRQSGAIAWVAGTQCARVFTAADLLAVQQNISDNIDLTNSMEDDISEYGDAIDDLETTVGGASSGLVKGLADEIARATAAENTEKTRAQSAETSIDNAKPNRSELAQLIVDWVYSQDAVKVLLTISRYNASTQQTTQFTKTLPVASAIAMGVMPPESYNEITNLRSDVTALQQQGGRFINQSFGTKAALESYTVPSSVNVGDFCFVLDDEGHSSATTRWIYNGTKGTSTVNQTTNGFAFGYIVTYDPVGIADSNTLGLVKSDVGTTNGKIFVETNGTMSLVGWDALATTVNGKLDKAGGTMTGPLVLSADPSASLGAATKQYVDNNKTIQNVWYGICETAIATVAKTVTITGFTSANLVAGTLLMLRVLYGNSATSPTLNINSLGAKDIKYQSAAPSDALIWPTLSTILLEYVGATWALITPDAYSKALAALPLAGGTMTGNIIAANQEVTVQGARNIYAGTDAMTAGTTDLTTGVIYLQYE